MLLGAMGTGGIWYYFTPKYSRVGYTPIQPVEYSHELHVKQIGLDCRYCHTHVTESANANIPTASMCWNCHGDNKGNVKADSAALAPLREAYKTGRAIDWVRVHKLPDFVYFNHAAHVRRGISCLSCHGQVNEMVRVRHDQPLSMSWCLDCHRDPAPNLRPNEQVTNLAWDPKRGFDPNQHPVMDRRTGKAVVARDFAEFGRLLRDNVGINPPVNCSGCHR
jgi:hypothetical protein